MATQDDRRFRMLQALVAEHMPVVLSTIVVEGPVLDKPMVITTYACLFGAAPNYQVFQTGGPQFDTRRLRSEIAVCRLPDYVNVSYTEAQAQRGWNDVQRVSRSLHVPIGFYGRGYYNLPRRQLSVKVLLFMGALPPSVFLQKLKQAARG